MPEPVPLTVQMPQMPQMPEPVPANAGACPSDQCSGVQSREYGMRIHSSLSIGELLIQVNSERGESKSRDVSWMSSLKALPLVSPAVSKCAAGQAA